MRRISRVLRSRWSQALVLGIVVCQDGTQVYMPGAPERPVARGVRGFFYQVARPIYDPAPQTRLYISGYAGRRPAPTYRPAGLQRHLQGFHQGHSTQGH